MEKYIGKIIDNRYEIISLIGVGGMSNVYKAVDKQSGQEVAVKFLKEEFFENEELVRRFKNESKAISVLNHGSIIKVIDFNITDSEKYLVVEYIDGVTLKEFLESRGKLSWEDTLVFANIILSALGHAHEHGVI
ncbi:MAG: protein kinase, partial [Oscillospiraceae bacterium]|nr:protein kinase [Oscillospiraceae bacterium]